MNRRDFIRRSGAFTGAASLSGLPLAAIAQPASDQGESTMPDDDRITVVADYYQQFDADYSLGVPGEGYGGWQKGEIDISASHTAVVVMHAWDCGTLDEFPGVWRSVEYVPRSIEIASTVFPPLLSAVRSSPLPLFHVVGGGDYYRECPGYKHAAELVEDSPEAPGSVEGDPVVQELGRFRSEKVWRGAHNNADGSRLSEALDFLSEARPQDDG